ncbi:ROK family glucokinase [Paenalkalicoccus suaedae]|uniref:Glucokinase n=1 Tax=Paenalkalicoccus suaedae TaxID=2592382 RepID=A0A859FK86_9BACI|nr:ROK family glucokinase [Paenalkalicoccus suaedae]
MSKDVVVGIDVGGTTVKLAFINLNGDIMTKWEIHTNRQEAGRYIVEDLATSVLEKAKEEQIDMSRVLACGVGAPGFIDVDHGVILEAVNLGWKDYEIQKELEALLAIPVVVDNDANVAAAGEKWKGAGENAENLLAVTLGTGVGGGIIAGGKIIHGVQGMAGEIGHITSIKEHGSLCNCGKRGCLETVASATGIARLGLDSVQEHRIGYLDEIFEEKGAITAKDVLDGAKQGDELAVEVLDEAMEHLGFALANLANSLNPEIIVIGGGVSKAGDFLIESLEKQFKRFAIPRIGRDTKLHIATLGNDAGVIGAAWLAQETYGLTSS